VYHAYLMKQIPQRSAIHSAKYGRVFGDLQRVVAGRSKGGSEKEMELTSSMNDVVVPHFIVAK
jgi:hypothetical protein